MYFRPRYTAYISWQSAGASALAVVATNGIARLSCRCLEYPLLRPSHECKYLAVIQAHDGQASKEAVGSLVLE